ncbi:response regulator [Carnobacteriaceae bacterium 52-44]|jgi:CheY-like chemotaxis protein
MVNLLIVEDDIAIHQLLIDILESETSYQFTSAYSGTEALMHLNHNSFDLILLDLMLLGMSDEEVLENIKETYYGGAYRTARS